MSDTFLANQEVTAQDLNNIAVDLGIAEYSYFPETPPQSAVGALNQITSDLVSAGVLLSENRCEVIYQDETIYVKTGVIVFNSGAKKHITDTTSITPIGDTNCIYAIHDTVNNKILLVCSDEFPITGDFVKLAEVTNGKVSDRRPFSAAKVSIPSGNQYVKHTAVISTSGDADVEVYQTTFDFGIPFQFAGISSQESPTSVVYLGKNGNGTFSLFSGVGIHIYFEGTAIKVYTIRRYAVNSYTVYFLFA